MKNILVLEDDPQATLTDLIQAGFPKATVQRHERWINMVAEVVGSLNDATMPDLLVVDGSMESNDAAMELIMAVRAKTRKGTILAKTLQVGLHVDFVVAGADYVALTGSDILRIITEMQAAN